MKSHFCLVFSGGGIYELREFIMTVMGSCSLSLLVLLMGVGIDDFDSSVFSSPFLRFVLHRGVNNLLLLIFSVFLIE